MDGKLAQKGENIYYTNTGIEGMQSPVLGKFDLVRHDDMFDLINKDPKAASHLNFKLQKNNVFYSQSVDGKEIGVILYISGCDPLLR